MNCKDDFVEVLMTVHYKSFGCQQIQNIYLKLNLFEYSYLKYAVSFKIMISAFIFN